MPAAFGNDGDQLGLVDRIGAAAKVLTTGKIPWENPLAEAPEDQSRAALVQELTLWATETRSFWKPVFDRIRVEQKFAAGKQWPKQYVCQSDNLEPYVGDVVQQLINRKTATLYAKNPTPEANRRERMEFTVWDGLEASYQGAQNTVQTAMQLKSQAMQLAATGMDVPPPPPEAERQVSDAQAIIADHDKGMMQKALMQKIAETATNLIGKQWEAQSPDLIVSMKQLVTRILTSRVGFIKCMYRRDGEAPVTEQANTYGLPDDLQSLKRAIARMEEPDFDKAGPEAEKIKMLFQAISYEQNPATSIPAEEGVVYDFLSATSVIIDRNCRCLKEFVGAKRIAHEILMTQQEAEKKYQISLLGAGAVMYADDGTVANQNYREQYKKQNEAAKNKTKVCVFEIQDKDTGGVYTIIDGVKDFVKEPEPNEPCLKRFFNIVAIPFNCQEVEFNDPDQDVTIYPRSDIRLCMPMQIDINTAGEGLREHRTANRPAWVGVRARFGGNAGENDLMKLASPRPANAVLMIDSLNPGEKISDFIQPLPTKEIDEAMYTTAPSNQAMMLATGMQPADIGTQRPDEKATGQQIAAQQKANTDSSNIEDLDFALSTLAQMTWEMLIQEMPSTVVKKLVGPGAAWPDMPAQRLETMNNIYLSIEAGSSGRPNQLLEIQNFTEIAKVAMPMVEQFGYDPEPWLKEMVRRMDDKLEIEDFLKKLPPPPPPPPEDKTTESISIALTDLSPEERAQALQNANIKPGGVIPQPKQPAQKTAASAK